MDVVVYTRSKNRPSVGRVAEVLHTGNFNLHWYSRCSKSKTFYAMFNIDGSKFFPRKYVMLWEMTTEKTETSSVLTDYWLGKIKDEYSNHDQCYQ